MRRECLEGGIGIPGGVEWQHLPELLTGGGEKVNESIRFRADVADAVRTRKGRGVEQNSAGAREFGVVCHAEVIVIGRSVLRTDPAQECLLASVTEKNVCATLARCWPWMLHEALLASTNS